MNETLTAARAAAEAICQQHAPEATTSMRTLLAVAWLAGHEAGSTSVVAIAREVLGAPAHGDAA